MLTKPDRSSKLSVISDVSCESETYIEQLNIGQLLATVEQLRSENNQLK